MRPLLGFLLGVLLSEIYQWGAWIGKNTGQTWRGYWAMGLPHLMTNAAGDVVIAVLWQMQVLDDLVGYVVMLIPGGAGYANVGIPFTIQVGVMVGFVADLFSDSAAYLLRTVIVPKIPWLGPLLTHKEAP
jgi:hypothetical protein